MNLCTIPAAQEERRKAQIQCMTPVNTVLLATQGGWACESALTFSWSPVAFQLK